MQRPMLGLGWLETLAEFAVLVWLFVTGLRIDTRESRAKRCIGLRLASVTMVLTMVVFTLLGHWLPGMPWGLALVLGAMLAPTDPVLAADRRTAQRVHCRGLDCSVLRRCAGARRLCLLAVFGTRLDVRRGLEHGRASQDGAANSVANVLQFNGQPERTVEVVLGIVVGATLVQVRTSRALLTPVAASIVLHVVSVTPLMEHYDRRHRRGRGPGG